MAEVAETKFITNFFLGSAAGITLLIILFSILLCPFHFEEPGFNYCYGLCASQAGKGFKSATLIDFFESHLKIFNPGNAFVRGYFPNFKPISLI